MARSFRKLVSGAFVAVVAVIALSYTSPAQAQSRHGHQSHNGSHYRGGHQGYGGYQRSHGGHYGGYQHGGYHGQHAHGYRPAPRHSHYHDYAPSFGGHYHGPIVDFHFGF